MSKNSRNMLTAVLGSIATFVLCIMTLLMFHMPKDSNESYELHDEEYTNVYPNDEEYQEAGEYLGDEDFFDDMIESGYDGDSSDYQGELSIYFQE